MTSGIIACLCIACFLLGGLIAFVLSAVLAAAGRHSMCEDCKYKEFYYEYKKKKAMSISEKDNLYK